MIKYVLLRIKVGRTCGGHFALESVTPRVFPVEHLFDARFRRHANVIAHSRHLVVRLTNSEQDARRCGRGN